MSTGVWCWCRVFALERGYFANSLTDAVYLVLSEGCNCYTLLQNFPLELVVVICRMGLTNVDDVGFPLGTARWLEHN